MVHIHLPSLLAGGSMHSQALSDETGTSTNCEASLYSTAYGEGKLNNSNRILEVPTHKKFSVLASIKDIPSVIFQSLKKVSISLSLSKPLASSTHTQIKVIISYY